MRDPATYWHMLPKANQARTAIWNAVNPHTGIRRIDEAFPKEVRETTQEQQMFIRFKTGAAWQLLGSDNYDSAVGSPPKGVVFSEWALADPAAWAYIRPILAENGGWALFITTPRGRNHAATMYESVKGDQDWYCERLTAEQTGVFDAHTLEKERKEYIDLYGPLEGLAKYEQEYFCSFEAAVVGSYYGHILSSLEQEDRIGSFPIIEGYPVHTAWDLGHTDATAIWFFQLVQGDVRLVDYYEANEVYIDHYIKVLKEKNYNYGKHVLPHDGGNQTILGSVYDILGKNFSGVTVLREKESVDQGVDRAARVLKRCQIDQEKCSRGLDCLRQYRRDWDTKKNLYKHVHDWTSHGADAFRYLAKGIDVLSAPEWGERIVSR